MSKPFGQPLIDIGLPPLRVIRWPSMRFITMTLCEYPQSGEIIHGRRNLQSLRSHHPGKPSGFVVRRVLGAGNLWITEYVISYEGRRACAVSIMEFCDGRVSHETQYFADRFDAPAWRAQWVEQAP